MFQCIINHYHTTFSVTENLSTVNNLWILQKKFGNRSVNRIVIINRHK